MIKRHDVSVIYVDESIHDGLGFIVTAFICAEKDVDREIADELLKLGFQPGIDEYKSSIYMGHNPLMKKLREQLLNIARTQSKIALLICPSHERKYLGGQILQSLLSIIKKNGIVTDNLNVFFDEGLFRSLDDGKRQTVANHVPSSINLLFQQDSKKIMGLQVADAVANVTSQIVREEITGIRKLVCIGGEGTGYADDEKANLGWDLLMGLRHNFFVRPFIQAELNERFDPDIDPYIINTEDDPADYGLHPRLLGWGVVISENLPQGLRKAVVSVFSRLWLGCIH
ncbi:MAG: hypothetical protein A2Y66_04425 [Nitrospirae bacterium RBG_13_41_22]|nr:MAG: hypothetical protein A2Y66_04425 [Nitrospirae bacterium RBG_13_41_22]